MLSSVRARGPSSAKTLAPCLRWNTTRSASSLGKHLSVVSRAANEKEKEKEESPPTGQGWRRVAAPVRKLTIGARSLAPVSVVEWERRLGSSRHMSSTSEGADEDAKEVSLEDMEFPNVPEKDGGLVDALHDRFKEGIPEGAPIYDTANSPVVLNAKKMYVQKSEVQGLVSEIQQYSEPELDYDYLVEPQIEVAEQELLPDEETKSEQLEPEEMELMKKKEDRLFDNIVELKDLTSEYAEHHDKISHEERELLALLESQGVILDRTELNHWGGVRRLDGIVTNILNAPPDDEFQEQVEEIVIEKGSIEDEGFLGQRETNQLDGDPSKSMLESLDVYKEHKIRERARKDAERAEREEEQERIRARKEKEQGEEAYVKQQRAALREGAVESQHSGDIFDLSTIDREVETILKEEEEEEERQKRARMREEEEEEEEEDEFESDVDEEVDDVDDVAAKIHRVNEMKEGEWEEKFHVDMGEEDDLKAEEMNDDYVAFPKELNMKAETFAQVMKLREEEMAARRGDKVQLSLDNEVDDWGDELEHVLDNPGLMPDYGRGRLPSTKREWAMILEGGKATDPLMGLEKGSLSKEYLDVFQHTPPEDGALLMEKAPEVDYETWVKIGQMVEYWQARVERSKRPLLVEQVNAEKLRLSGSDGKFRVNIGQMGTEESVDGSNSVLPDQPLLVHPEDIEEENDFFDYEDRLDSALAEEPLSDAMRDHVEGMRPHEFDPELSGFNEAEELERIQRYDESEKQAEKQVKLLEAEFKSMVRTVKEGKDVTVSDPFAELETSMYTMLNGYKGQGQDQDEFVATAEKYLSNMKAQLRDLDDVPLDGTVSKPHDQFFKKFLDIVQSKDVYKKNPTLARILQQVFVTAEAEMGMLLNYRKEQMQALVDAAQDKIDNPEKYYHFEEADDMEAEAEAEAEENEMDAIDIEEEKRGPPIRIEGERVIDEEHLLAKDMALLDNLGEEHVDRIRVLDVEVEGTAPGSLDYLDVDVDVDVDVGVGMRMEEDEPLVVLSADEESMPLTEEELLLQEEMENDPLFKDDEMEQDMSEDEMFEDQMFEDQMFDDQMSEDEMSEDEMEEYAEDETEEVELEWEEELAMMEEQEAKEAEEADNPTAAPATSTAAAVAEDGNPPAAEDISEMMEEDQEDEESDDDELNFEDMENVEPELLEAAKKQLFSYRDFDVVSDPVFEKYADEDEESDEFADVLKAQADLAKPEEEVVVDMDGLIPPRLDLSLDPNTDLGLEDVEEEFEELQDLADEVTYHALRKDVDWDFEAKLMSDAATELALDVVTDGADDTTLAAEIAALEEDRMQEYAEENAMVEEELMELEENELEEMEEMEEMEEISEEDDMDTELDDLATALHMTRGLEEASDAIEALKRQNRTDMFDATSLAKDSVDEDMNVENNPHVRSLDEQGEFFKDYHVGQKVISMDPVTHSEHVGDDIIEEMKNVKFAKEGQEYVDQGEILGSRVPPVEGSEEDILDTLVADEEYYRLKAVQSIPEKALDREVAVDAFTAELYERGLAKDAYFHYVSKHNENLLKQDEPEPDTELLDENAFMRMMLDRKNHEGDSLFQATGELSMDTDQKVIAAYMGDGRGQIEAAEHFLTDDLILPSRLAEARMKIIKQVKISQNQEVEEDIREKEEEYMEALSELENLSYSQQVAGMERLDKKLKEEAKSSKDEDLIEPYHPQMELLRELHAVDEDEGLSTRMRRLRAAMERADTASTDMIIDAYFSAPSDDVIADPKTLRLIPETGDVFYVAEHCWPVSKDGTIYDYTLHGILRDSEYNTYEKYRVTLEDVELINYLKKRMDQRRMAEMLDTAFPFHRESLSEDKSSPYALGKFHESVTAGLNEVEPLSGFTDYLEQKDNPAFHMDQFFYYNEDISSVDNWKLNTLRFEELYARINEDANVDQDHYASYETQFSNDGGEHVLGQKPFVEKKEGWGDFEEFDLMRSLDPFGEAASIRPGAMLSEVNGGRIPLAQQELMYQLNLEDPRKWCAKKLSEQFSLNVDRVRAILKLKYLEYRLLPGTSREHMEMEYHANREEDQFMPLAKGEMQGLNQDQYSNMPKIMDPLHFHIDGMVNYFYRPTHDIRDIADEEVYDRKFSVGRQLVDLDNKQTMDAYMEYPVQMPSGAGVVNVDEDDPAQAVYNFFDEEEVDEGDGMVVETSLRGERETNRVINLMDHGTGPRQLEREINDQEAEFGVYEESDRKAMINGVNTEWENLVADYTDEDIQRARTTNHNMYQKDLDHSDIMKYDVPEEGVETVDEEDIIIAWDPVYPENRNLFTNEAIVDPLDAVSMKEEDAKKWEWKQSRQLNVAPRDPSLPKPDKAPVKNLPRSKPQRYNLVVSDTSTKGENLNVKVLTTKGYYRNPSRHELAAAVQTETPYAYARNVGISSDQPQKMWGLEEDFLSYRRRVEPVPGHLLHLYDPVYVAAANAVQPETTIVATMPEEYEAMLSAPAVSLAERLKEYMTKYGDENVLEYAKAHGVEDLNAALDQIVKSGLVRDDQSSFDMDTATYVESSDNLWVNEDDEHYADYAEMDKEQFEALESKTIDVVDFASTDFSELGSMKAIEQNVQDIFSEDASISDKAFAKMEEQIDEAHDVECTVQGVLRSGSAGITPQDIELMMVERDDALNSDLDYVKRLLKDAVPASYAKDVAKMAFQKKNVGFVRNGRVYKKVPEKRV